MMKLLLTYLLLFIAAYMSAQSISKSVVGNEGTELSGSEVTINFTVGEPIVGLITNNHSIDQGFWAGSLYVEPITEEKDLGDIVVYPNPVVDILNIFTNQNQVYGITLFSVNGQKVLQQKVKASELEHQIDFSNLTKGMYVLQLFVEKESKPKLFKIIKK